MYCNTTQTAKQSHCEETEWKSARSYVYWLNIDMQIEAKLFKMLTSTKSTSENHIVFIANPRISFSFCWINQWSTLLDPGWYYRATQNPRTPKGDSTTKALMNRKICLSVDTKLQNTLTRETEWWNNSSIAIMEQPVLANNYCNGKEKWTPGYIICHTGNVIYDIDVQSSIWVKHTNQLTIVIKFG